MADVISAYKEYFPKHWKDEKYKWEAIKHFQKHWDVNAADFKAMLETSPLFLFTDYLSSSRTQRSVLQPCSVSAVSYHIQPL